MRNSDVPPAVRRLLDRRMPRGLTVRHIDMKNFMTEFDMVIDIFNDAWSENWGFVPFTPAELKHMAKGLKPLLRPEITAIVELHGKPIGFSIALPNLNEPIRDFGGRLLPFNWLKLLLRLKRGTRTARVALLGIRRNLEAGLLVRADALPAHRHHATRRTAGHAAQIETVLDPRGQPADAPRGRVARRDGLQDLPRVRKAVVVSAPGVPDRAGAGGHARRR